MNTSSPTPLSPSKFVILTSDELSAMFQTHEERVVARISSLVGKTSPKEEKYFSRREVAEKLGVTLQTLSRYIREEGLCPSKIGNRVVFKASDFNEWLAEKRVKSSVSAQ